MPTDDKNLCQRWRMWHRLPYPRSCILCSAMRGLSGECRFRYDIRVVPGPGTEVSDPPLKKKE